MTPNPRCVVDTNVLISAVLFPGSPPDEVLYTVFRHGILLASGATYRELTTRLRRSKFDRYVSREGREEYLDLILANSRFVVISETVRASTDPDDNNFLELAVNGQADVIITGDKKHLLPLNPFRGIPILSPRTFLEEIGASEK